jgi:hypothetical protein
MKQRFLNQKLGKRMSRKTGLQKAKVSVVRPTAPPRIGKAPQGPAPENAR